MSRVPLKADPTTTDIVSFLASEFKQHLSDQGPEATLSPEQLAGIEQFTDFARNYLDENRPNNLLNALDQNYQVFLTNNKTFAISPIKPSGVLPNSGAVSCSRHS